jgi:hypothetical protein
VLAHGLAVETSLARDGGHGQPLPPQVMDHDDFLKSDHPALSRTTQGALSGT